MSFDTDDGKRPSLGVVVSLLDLGDGQSRLIMDDVRSQHPVRETSWNFDVFYTHQSHGNSALTTRCIGSSSPFRWASYCLRFWRRGFMQSGADNDRAFVPQ